MQLQINTQQHSTLTHRESLPKTVTCKTDKTCSETKHFLSADKSAARRTHAQLFQAHKRPSPNRYLIASAAQSEPFRFASKSTKVIRQLIWHVCIPKWQHQAPSKHVACDQQIAWTLRMRMYVHTIRIEFMIRRINPRSHTNLKHGIISANHMYSSHAIRSC